MLVTLRFLTAREVTSSAGVEFSSTNATVQQRTMAVKRSSHDALRMTYASIEFPSRAEQRLLRRNNNCFLKNIRKYLRIAQPLLTVFKQNKIYLAKKYTNIKAVAYN